MATSRRVCVDWVRYGDGNVYARVHVQVIDDASAVLADLDPITLQWLESDVVAQAVADGRTDWNNADVEQLLLAAQIPSDLTVVVPGVPAQPAVVNPGTGELLRSAVDAVPPSVRAPGLRFEGISTVVWAGPLVEAAVSVTPPPWTNPITGKVAAGP